jgi:hypothetical protein
MTAWTGTSGGIVLNDQGVICVADECPCDPTPVDLVFSYQRSLYHFRIDESTTPPTVTQWPIGTLTGVEALDVWDDRVWWYDPGSSAPGSSGGESCFKRYRLSTATEELSVPMTTIPSYFADLHSGNPSSQQGVYDIYCGDQCITVNSHGVFLGEGRRDRRFAYTQLTHDFTLIDSVQLQTGTYLDLEQTSYIMTPRNAYHHGGKLCAMLISMQAYNPNHTGQYLVELGGLPSDYRDTYVPSSERRTIYYRGNPRISLIPGADYNSAPVVLPGGFEAGWFARAGTGWYPLQIQEDRTVSRIVPHSIGCVLRNPTDVLNLIVAGWASNGYYAQGHEQDTVIAEYAPFGWSNGVTNPRDTLWSVRMFDLFGDNRTLKAICRDGNANSLFAFTHNPSRQEVDLSRIDHLAGTVRWTHATGLPSPETTSYGTTNGRLDRNTLAMLDDGGAGRGAIKV